MSTGFAGWRGTIAQAAAGLAVALGLLGGVELLLRLALGPPPPPPPLHAMWDGRSAPFRQEGAHTFAEFLDPADVRPIPSRPVPGVPRVVFLGGSSVHGQVDVVEFPARVGEILARRGSPVEAINLGRPGLDSHGLKAVAAGIDALAPDVAVLYLGHNDIGNVVMKRRYGHRAGAGVARVRLGLGRLQLYRVLRDGLGAGASASGSVAAGRSAGQVPAQHYRDVERVFGENLAEIVGAIQASGAAVVLVTPVSNLLVTPPNGPSCTELLPPGVARTMNGRHALDASAITPEQVAGALALAPDCADLLFLRGQHRRWRGDRGALDDLLRVAELDPLPTRATQGILDAIRRVARTTGADLVDLEAETRAGGGPPPSWFRDNLHFNAQGHAEVAEHVAPAVAHVAFGRLHPKHPEPTR